MRRKIVSGLVLTTLLVGILAMVFSIQVLKASGTIYIRPDGSVEGTDKIQRDGDIYTFDENIYGSIIVERDNIVLDGANFTLEGMGSEIGIDLSGGKGIRVQNMEIRVFEVGIKLLDTASCTISKVNIVITDLYAISLDGSSNNTISEVNITANDEWCILLHSLSCHNIISESNIDSLNNGEYGIRLEDSSNNTITDNTVKNNQCGIYIELSNDSKVIGNTVTNSSNEGISIWGSPNNSIFGNTVVSNWNTGIGIISGPNSSIIGNTVTDHRVDGISISRSSNSSIIGNTVTENNYASNYGGVQLAEASNNDISGNVITSNVGHGVSLIYSSNNNIAGNTITNNSWSISLSDYCYNNSVSDNTMLSGGLVIGSDYNNITRNNILHSSMSMIIDGSYNRIKWNNIAYSSYRGIDMGLNAEGNSFHHNNILDNTDQVKQNGRVNFWDDGFEGNYWGDYEGKDTDGDGIGDTETPHYKDRYPFIVPIGSIPILYKETRYDCIIDGSMTVSRFSLDENKTISFNITGEGYVNLTMPRNMLDGSFHVFINDILMIEEYTSEWLTSWNTTKVSICFAYSTSTTVKVKLEAEIKLLGDLNSDEIVNIRDIFIVAKNFGKTLED